MFFDCRKSHNLWIIGNLHQFLPRKRTRLNGNPLSLVFPWRVGVNRFALPVAEQAKRFTAQRSARDEGASSPRTIAEYRKRDHIKILHQLWGIFHLSYFTLIRGRHLSRQKQRFLPASFQGKAFGAVMCNLMEKWKNLGDHSIKIWIDIC